MKNLQLLLISTAVLGLSSCSPKFYSPNTQNVPLISAQGEGSITLAGNGNQIELQGAYGIGKNIAIKLDGGAFIPAKLDNGNGGSGQFIEIGGGYFKPLDNNLVFETYAIVGVGSFKNYLPASATNSPLTKGDISANILRIGIQPNFGYKSKNFSAAVSSRFVNLTYNKIAGDLIFDGVNQIAYLKDNSSNFLIEPAITVRGGFENIKLQLQYGYSFNVSNSDFKQDKSNLTIGINYNFK